MPDAVGALSDVENNDVVQMIVGKRQGVMKIARTGLACAEPGVAEVETSAKLAAIVVQNDVFAVHAAGELHFGDFDLGGFISRNAGVGDGDSPQQNCVEGPGRWNGVDVSRFPADIVRDTRIVADQKGGWRSGAPGWRDCRDAGLRGEAWDQGNQFFRGDDPEVGW